MHKKFLSIVLAILLIVPVGSVFAEDGGVPTPAPEASQSPEISPYSTAYTVGAIPEQQGVDLAIESTFPEYNVPVTLVATPQGDPSLTAQAEYRYVYLYGSSWSVIREWGDSNTCEWTPPKVGTYTIYVYTRTKGRTTNRDTMDHIQYYASDITRQTGVTLTTDKPPVQEAGTEITLTAQNGSSDPALAARAEYQFRYKLGSQWTTLKDWSGESTCTWTPDTKGTYTLYVYTRTAGRSGYDAYDTYAYDVDIEPLTGVTLTADRATPQQAGTAITLTASAEGRHAGSAEYLFRVNDGSSWRTIKDWRGENTCTWTPQNEYMCTVEVQARAAGRSGADQAATIENYFVYTGSLPVSGLDVTVSPDSPQEYDTPVRIQAQATGDSADGSEEYQYRVQSGSNWSTLSPWSTAKDITWTPPSPGTYTIEVRTRAVGRSGYDAIYMDTYTIRDVPVQQGVDLSIESAFPEYNVPVTLVATPHGDPSLAGRAEYRYVYRYGSGWYVIREWDDSPSCEWTPPKVGTYYIYVYTRTRGRTTNRDTMDHIQYYASDITRQTGVTLTPDKPPVQEAGTEITLTAQPTTTNEELKARAEYQFRYKLGNQWTTLKDWSGENTCTWTPDTKGTYTLYVYTRTAGRSGYDAYDTYAYDVDIEPLTSVSLTADRATPQQAGTAITLTAAAEGRHADNTEYLFRVKDGLLWRTIKSWSGESTCTWTPQNEYMCTVEVQARAAGRSGADQTATIENYFVYTGSLPVSGLDVTVSPDSPQEYNTPVKIQAQAAGDSADGTEEYQLRIKQGLLWSTLSPWSTAKDFTWTPAKPGDYAIEVRTRAAGRSGYDAIYTDTYTIRDVPEQQGVDMAIESTFTEYNIPVTLVATPQGDPSLAGQAEYRYVYQYRSSWYVIREWADSNTCEWTPPKVGTHTIYVYTRTKGRTTNRDTMDHVQYYASDITRQTGVTLTPDKPPVQEAGTEITLTAQPSTANEELKARAEYQFGYKLGNQWTTLKDWSGENTCTWTPDTKGTYTLYVYTRTAGRSGYDAYDTYAYDVDIEPLTGVSLTADRATPQQAGTAITLTAAAEGRHADNTEYLFRVKDGLLWRTIKGWSGESTCTWTPQNEYMCTVEVQARAAGRSGADQTATIENYFVYTGSLPVSGLDVTVSPASPQEYDTPVRIQAQATGDSADGTEEYQLRIKQGLLWSTLSPWSTAKDFTWTPAKPGDYTIEIRTRASGRSGHDAIYTATYTVTDIRVQQGVALSTDMVEGQEYGTNVTLTATPQGDPSLAGRAEYRYIYQYGGKWTVLQEWTDSSTLVWNPPNKGAYDLRVYTRTKGRTSDYDTYDTITCTFADIPKQSGVTLSTDIEPVQEPGTTVNLTWHTTETDPAVAARAEYQVQCLVGGTWSVLLDWGTDTAYAWTPDVCGEHTLRVFTRTAAASRSGYDSYASKSFTIDTTPLTGVTLTADPPSPVEPETPVTFTATAIGLYAAQAEYRFTMYNGSSWYAVRNGEWSGINNFQLRPSHPLYRIKVEARSPGSTTADVSCTISFRVGTGGDYADYTYSANTMAMLQDLYGGAVKSSGGSWVDASQSDILNYVDPNNWLDGQYKYQFLSLNYISGIKATDLNAILSDNSQNGGVLNGKGSVFLAAAQQYDINPAYLVSHAMLETGNGTSELARGIVVNGKKVYNMYGIHAYDSNPNYYGAQYAYEKGWTSVDKAITGGAEWISSNYINRSSGEQNTLYAMRWNPNAIQKQIDSGDTTPRPTHQYATDIAWAVKQVSRLKSLMDRCVDAVLEFIIPNYN